MPLFPGEFEVWVRSYGPNSGGAGPLGPSGVGRVGDLSHFEGPGGPDPMKLGFGRLREGLGGPLWA